MEKFTEYIISGDICTSQLLLCIIVIFIREKKNYYFLVRASWNRSSFTNKVL